MTSWQAKRIKGELPKIDELPRIADLPLLESEKIPVTARQMRDLVSRPSDMVLDDFCSQSDVDLLFRLGAGNILGDKIFVAIFKGPPALNGTEKLFHSFWDTNIRDILEIVLPRGRSIRHSSRNTETGNLRPNYAYLLKNLALFRGEDKSPSNHEDNPKDELSVKLEWAYRPAPYVLGEC